MPFLLFILFVAVPFIELALLIFLGQQVGFWPTIGLVVATAVLGAVVLNYQGLQTMQRISAALSSGEPPIQPVVDGFFLVISGAFLLTPGVITDAAGLLLLVPQVRRAIARWVFSRVLRHGSFTVNTYRTDGARDASGRPEASRVDDDFFTGPSGSPSGTPGGAPGDGRERDWHGPGRSGERKPRPRPSSGPVIDGEFEEIEKKP